MALINEFIGWLFKETKKEYVLEERPEPPDGVLRSRDGKNIVWVEIARVFRSEDEARRLNQPSEGEVSSEIISPDEQMANAVLKVIRMKIEGKDYSRCVTLYGAPGYLLLAEAYPLFDDHTLDGIRKVIANAKYPADRHCFKTVLMFISGKGGNQIINLPYSG